MKLILLLFLALLSLPLAGRSESAATALDNELTAMGVSGTSVTSRFANATQPEIIAALAIAVSEFPASPDVLLQYVLTGRKDSIALAPKALAAAIQGVIQTPYTQFNTLANLQNTVAGAASAVNAKLTGSSTLDAALETIAESALAAGANSAITIQAVITAVDGVLQFVGLGQRPHRRHGDPYAARAGSGGRRRRRRLRSGHIFQ